MDNQLLVSGSDDFSISVWRISSSKLIYRFDRFNGGHKEVISSLVSLGNGLFASGSNDNTIKIWDSNNGKLKFTLDTVVGGHTNW